MKMTTPPLACVASGERMPDGSGCNQNAEQRIQEFRKRKISKDWIPGCRYDRQGGARESEVVQCS